MPTLRQFEYFLAVVEERSFTRAAHAHHVAQPSLSQQIRLLERELGGSLIERLPRSIRLTPAGRAFFPHAQAAIQGADRACRAARAALRLEEGELEISTVRSIAAGLLPEMLGRWQRRYPGTVVRLYEFTHRRLAEDSVREGIAEIGMGPPPPNWSGATEVIGWEEFVVVLAPDDALAGRVSVPLNILSDRDWVLFHRDNGLYDLIIDACARVPGAPFRPRGRVITSQVEAAARYAAAGLGPTLVPENTIPRGLEHVALRAEPPVGRRLSLYVRDDWGEFGGAFRRLVAEQRLPEPPLDAMIIS